MNNEWSFRRLITITDFFTSFPSLILHAVNLLLWKKILCHTLWENVGESHNVGESLPAVRNAPFLAPKRSPLPNSNFYVITQYKLHLSLYSLLLYNFFNLRFYIHIWHANYDESIFNELYLQYENSIEWSKFSQPNFRPPDLSVLFRKLYFN